MNRQFENFDLEFSRAAEGYTARVLSSPGGEGSQPFTVSITTLELENVVLQVLAARNVRSITSKQGSRLRNLGGALFKSVFVGDVLQCYLRSLASCTEGRGLRIRLRFADTPELVNLPWELLYDEGIDQWVALKLDTPLVRYLRLPTQIAPLKVNGPLNVLTVISDPSDVPHLDIESEAQAVEVALRLLKTSDPNAVATDTLRHPTPELLQRKLIELPWHVLHFIGHGQFDERTGSGVLILEDENGKARPITSERLSVMLQGRALRLVILNSCEGARSGDDDHSGLAQSLIAQGVPAVIAMQFPITDTAALAFSRMFYHALVHGESLENAVVEARRAIFQESELEWATPTLYLRSENGLLFERIAPVIELPAVVVVSPKVDPIPPKTEIDAETVTDTVTDTEKKELENARLRTVVVDPVPPVPKPWWRRPAALLGLLPVAAAIIIAWPHASPTPSPAPSDVGLATLAPFLATDAPSAAPTSTATSGALFGAGTPAPDSTATANPERPSAHFTFSPEILRANPLFSRPHAAFSLTAFATACPMPNAVVQDTFKTDTHLWNLSANATITGNYLYVEPTRGSFQQVLHHGTMSGGTVCTTVYGLPASIQPLVDPDYSGSGLVFWYTPNRFWAFFLTPSNKFRVQSFDYKMHKWNIIVAPTSSTATRRVPILGTLSNVLTVQLKAGTANFYINGSKVSSISGGPSGSTQSGVIAETQGVEKRSIRWAFGYYGVAP